MSNINIQPLNNKLIVLPEPKKEMTEGGIHIPDSAKEMVNLIWGTVKRVSAKIPEVKEGERVLFPAGAGTEQEINGTKYKFLDDQHLWGIDVPVTEKDTL
jgi:co-chaperonin GroES (HSP10)